jgi:hypothetical protein
MSDHKALAMIESLDILSMQAGSALDRTVNRKKYRFFQWRGVFSLDKPLMGDPFFSKLRILLACFMQKLMAGCFLLN